MTFSRLLALGGFTTALTGSSFAYYRYNLLENGVTTADCKAVELFEDDDESSPTTVEKKRWDDNWDLRNNRFASSSQDTILKEKVEVPLLDAVYETIGSCPSEPKPTATRHILLVRHGQYVHNDKDCFRILTDLGKQQSTLTGERLKSLGIKFNKMIVSTMTRAQETGGLIAEALTEAVEKDYCSLLREGAPYPIDPKSSVWNPNDRTYFKDNPRIEGAFRKYIHRADPKQIEDSHDLLVCHANVIRYFVCRSLQFPLEGWGRMSIAHCGLTWLSILPNGRVSLRGLGDIGHLPPDLITYS